MTKANTGDVVADRILDFISGPESGGNYNAVFGRAKSTHDLSQYTVKQILNGEHFSAMGGKVRGQSATGRYQIIKKTLASLVEDLRLSPQEMFNPALQDRLGLELLRKRGYLKWRAGSISDEMFALNLAMEWASLPHPKTGRSYYAGDGLNKSHVTPKQVLAVLRGE